MRFLAQSLVALVFLACAPAFAEEQPPARVGRVSAISGTLAFYGPGETEWSAAKVNYPVATGGWFATDPQSRAEIRIGAETIDMAGDTQLDITDLRDRATQIGVAQGRVDLNLRRLATDETAEVDIPRGSVSLLQPGVYDIETGTPDQPTRIAVFEGSARFVGGGADLVVKAGDAVVLNGSDTVSATVERATADAFVKWCRSRDYHENKLAAPYHVSPAMTGFEELDAHGGWDTVPNYGAVWHPSSVPADWAPYRDGQWVWVEPWGWTWVDAGLWGFAASGVAAEVEARRSRGTGAGYSFATARPEGFRDDDLVLLKAVLPVASLAMMTHAGHTIASGLLEAYLGGDAGRRVHAGAVERGSVECIRAVFWYADIRGFTAIADATPGLIVIELLNEVFETLTASLRQRGGQVLKFLGDGMLATFPLVDATRDQICRRALDAATEAMHAVDRLNAARREAGKPIAAVDLALHLGEVLYGNVGAIDRLDFTVIGPAVNEVARIEALCEPLGRKVLVSAELAAAVGNSCRLEPLGHHTLRGVRDASEIYGLNLGSKP